MKPRRIVQKPYTVSAHGDSVKTEPSEAEGGTPNRDMYAQVCYFYPQYTLEDVQQMPARDVNLLIKTAHQQKAIDYLNFTQIVAAPHTKKGEGVKKLADSYQKIIKN